MAHDDSIPRCDESGEWIRSQLEAGSEGEGEVGDEDEIDSEIEIDEIVSPDSESSLFLDGAEYDPDAEYSDLKDEQTAWIEANRDAIVSVAETQ